MKQKLERREYKEGYSDLRGNLLLAKCFRCGHEWIPRAEVIRTCSNCRSPYWDKAKNKKDFVEMRIWALGIIQNARYRQFIGKAIFEKCIDCGKKARYWEHRNYARPLLVEPVCGSCNHKRGHSNNFTKK